MLARKTVCSPSRLVPQKEVCFHPHSFADDAGRLFWWEGRLCRGINSEQAAFFERLFREGILQSLIERGFLIKTEATDLTLDGYAMVVRHRRIPFISYPNEWCAAMLKDAALTIIDLMIELARLGLTLKDAHPWNVLFEACKPVYVDLTSIVPQVNDNDSDWPAYDEFCRFCYYPLILMSHNQERIGRALLSEYEGVLRRELLTIMRGSAPSRFILSRLSDRAFNSIKSIFGKRKSKLDFLKQARRNIEKIRLPYENRRSKQNDESALPLFKSDWTDQQQALGKILAELQPESVLDLSRGSVWTSTFPALLGHNVVSVDAEPQRASSIYEIARSLELPILPLIIDFIKPTPSVGYSNHYSIAATERLKCDLVLAFGLVYQTVFERYLNFDLIVEGLSSFSKRWLVVEFARLETRSSIGRPGGKLAWYTLDNFVGALHKRFSNVTVLSSHAKPEVLLLCEK